MSKKPETTFSELFKKNFDKMFKGCGKIENIQQVAKSGTPDYMGALRGKFVAFELKALGGVIAPLQFVKLMEFNKAGGLCYIVYPHTMNRILNEVDRITKGSWQK